MLDRQYVRNEERFHTFVANRVMEIRSKSSGEDWHHVPTPENPSDEVFRVISAVTLGQTRWLHGPGFLAASPENWPNLSGLPPLAE